MKQGAAWRPRDEDCSLIGFQPGFVPQLCRFVPDRWHPVLPERERHFPEDCPDSRPPVDFPWRSALNSAGAFLPAVKPKCSARNQGKPSLYAFPPTCNSATLKGTPHPPIPQYPSGFFARYCW